MNLKSQRRGEGRVTVGEISVTGPTNIISYVTFIKKIVAQLINSSL